MFGDLLKSPKVRRYPDPVAGQSQVVSRLRILQVGGISTLKLCGGHERPHRIAEGATQQQ